MLISPDPDYLSRTGENGHIQGILAKGGVLPELIHTASIDSPYNESSNYERTLSVCEVARSDWKAREMTSNLAPSSMERQQMLTQSGIFLMVML